MASSTPYVSCQNRSRRGLCVCPRLCGFSHVWTADSHLCLRNSAGFVPKHNDLLTQEIRFACSLIFTTYYSNCYRYLECTLVCLSKHAVDTAINSHS